MGQYANFYNSRNGDRVYNADSMSEWLLPFFTTGVFNNCFAVTATGDGMNISVGGGYVNIKGKTKHFEQAQIFTLEKASGTLARIDNVILRKDDTERDFYILIETGGFSKNPVAPEITRTETGRNQGGSRSDQDHTGQYNRYTNERRRLRVGNGNRKRN